MDNMRLRDITTIPNATQRTAGSFVLLKYAVAETPPVISSITPRSQLQTDT